MTRGYETDVDIIDQIDIVFVPTSTPVPSGVVDTIVETWKVALLNTCVRILDHDGGPCWCTTYDETGLSTNHATGTRCDVARRFLNGNPDRHPLEHWQERTSSLSRRSTPRP